jgi:hypothetical protein
MSQNLPSIIEIFRDSNINIFTSIRIDDKYNIQFTIDQTKLFNTGICFLNNIHKNFKQPLVISATVLDTTNIIPSYFYFSEIIQEKINSSIHDPNNTLAFTFVKIDLLRFTPITNMNGVTQKLSCNISFV